MVETPENGILKDAEEESKISRIRSECYGKKMGYRVFYVKEQCIKIMLVSQS